MPRRRRPGTGVAVSLRSGSMDDSPPPAQVPVPPPQPAPPGWSRFWLGVLAGGCGVVVLEAVATLVLLLVIGVTIGSAVRSATNGGSGLPGLPLPSGLPQIATRGDPCSPQPCVAHGGVTVLISDVNRNAGPAPDGRAHLVELDVTFVGTAGTHTVTSEEVVLRDSSGAPIPAGVDPAPAGCDSTPVTADVAAGQRLGPYHVCYEVSDPASAPLTLIWVNPEDLAAIQLTLSAR